MKYTVIALLVLVHTVLIGAQFVDVVTYINNNMDANAIPGGQFDLDIDVELTGFATTTSVCTFNFTAETILTPGAVAACTDLNGNGINYECIVAWNTSMAVSSQVLTPISGTASFPACAGDTWAVDYFCTNPGTGGDESGNDQFTLSDSTVLVEAGVYANNITNDTIDFNTNEFFTVIYTVRNVNDCPASGVQCELTFPERFTGEDNPGLVEFIQDDPSTTVSDNLCVLEGLTFTCPQDGSPRFNLALDETIEIGAAFQLTGNGTLVFTMQCNATLLSDPDLATSRIEFEGINVPAPEEPGFTSDDSDDLIVNTVIPLAIFVCIMVILCAFIWAGVIGYIIYSKATADESF